MMHRFAYAGMMLAAAGLFLLVRRCFPARTGGLMALSRADRAAIGLAAFIGGVLGAKLPFVFVRGGDWFGMAWLADGKTVTTGLLGAYLGVELAKWVRGVKVKTGDSFALPLALALAVGRWGCFFHGCCCGRPTDLPWGVDFGDGIPRHPTQIYESLFHFSMAILLLQMFRLNWLPNQRLKLYLIAYGIYRFLTEYIRPEPEYALGMTYFQWVAFVLAAGLSGQWVYETASRHSFPIPPFPIPPSRLRCEASGGVAVRGIRRGPLNPRLISATPRGRKPCSAPGEAPEAS